ncbi:MAG: PEGA domain-containing protein, partial [Pyrinomonadaceae bacterium]
MAADKFALAGKLAFAVLIAFTFIALPASTAYARKRKPAKYGTIKIRTLPGGLPLEIDGKPYGETTTEDRSFDLDPGVHAIVLALPNGKHWTREVSLEAGRIKCVALNYRPAPPPPPKSPCPFPVNLSAPSQVSEGEIITYTSDVAYSGASALTYTWTVSPANAKLLSGVGTPTITVDSTG